MKISLMDVPFSNEYALLSEFLSIPPDASDGVERSRKQLESRNFPRQELADVLHRYNADLGNDDLALANARRLAEPDSVCVLTGQQLGFMGGPIYTFLKALSCLLLARETGAIPIFWAATEDHDINEIDHAYQLNPYGNLVRYVLHWPQSGAAVEDLPLLPQHKEVIRAYWQALSPLSNSLPAQELQDDNYSRAMMRLLVHAFAGTGMVFLEPRVLRPFAKEFFAKEITDCEAMTATLTATTQRLVQTGGKGVLAITNGPNLFYKDSNGYRRRIHFEQGAYRIGSRSISRDELLKELSENSDRFSPSAAARPVMQNLLLPTIAYVAGPTELQYHAQLFDYHVAHGAHMPWIIPRISATLITPQARQILDSLQLQPWDEIPTGWNEVMPNIDQLGGQLEKACSTSVSSLFGTQVLPNVHHSLSHFVHQVKEKAIIAKLVDMGLHHHSLHLLHNLLQPQGKPQERVLGWWVFQACTSANLVHQLLDHLNYRETGHYFIDLTG
ncbi:MAG: bacillithiol biosynthesis cysteine-adding enzyme BshC [Chlamydiales bacterium]|nr:bacillithiol biosynthesis cysteine-adding enzyme BshC [Chlamydiales bacterium]